MTIRITAKIEGFRRAGIAHSRTPTDHADDAFSEEQMEQLFNEPNLIIELDSEGEKKEKPLTVAQRGALIKAVTTLEELEVLAAGEENIGLLKFLAKRRLEFLPQQG